MSHSTNTAHAAAPAASHGTVVVEIAGLDVTLPVKFIAGHVLTEKQALALDAAYQRQFTNNQNANAKSRKDAFDAAKTDEERAAKRPLTVAEIAALYTDYEPSVGGTPRQSVMEKIRHEAAWRFWSNMVTEHNQSVADGGEPVIVRAGKKAVTLGFKAVKEGDKVVTTAAEQKEAFCARLLTIGDYSAGIQEHIDAITAERGSKTTPAADATVSSADLI